MGDNPDHLRLMLRESAARTAGVEAYAPDAAPARGALARLAARLKSIFAGAPAKAEVK
ncbi:MAG: hypothetical protein AAF322_09530 [Pseudomonadota bacterium]